MQKVISFEFTKGPKFATEFVKEETDLTVDMLARYNSLSIIDGLNKLTCSVVHGRMRSSNPTISRLREL